MSHWKQLHEEVIAVGKHRSQEEHRLGRLLLRVKKARIWQRVKRLSFYAYARDFLNLTTRQAKERIRIAKALKKLPKLDASQAAGVIHYSAVRELLRVVTPENENEWLERVRDMTVDEIAMQIEGTQRGDAPPDTKVPRRRRVILRMSPAVLALYRAAQDKLREESGGELSEEDGVMLMARMVLGGTDARTNAYQIQMTVCQTCETAVQHSAGEVVPVEPREVEQARCDADLVGAAAQVVVPSHPDIREQVVTRQERRCGFPGCQNEVATEVHVLPGEAQGTPDPDLRVALCAVHHAANHRGDLRIEGRWSTDFRFLDIDGTLYRDPLNEQVSTLMTELGSGLRHLGFKERERRAIVDRIRSQVDAESTISDVALIVLGLENRKPTRRAHRPVKGGPLMDDAPANNNRSRPPKGDRQDVASS